MIRVTDLEKSFGGRVLFEGATVEFVAPNRYGLIGANGSGKSTLARMLAGDDAPTRGTIAMPKRVRVGVLRQDRFENDDQRIVDVVSMGNPEVYEALCTRERLLATMAREDFDAEGFAAAEDVIARFDGYTLESRASEILEGLGIPARLHREPLRVLSGGFKLRVLLAQTLAARPEVLILDEPTNHLDIVSIRWLERFLLAYDGCAIVISHDRRFLDTICTHIVDVDYQTLTLYPGNYAAFERQKDAARAQKQAEIDKRERQIADHQEFIDRFRAKATKARQAQSRMKQMERIVIERLPESTRRQPHFRFTPARPSGREVLELSGLQKSFGDKRVLTDVTLTVRRGERLAILGVNGVGKSTLLKIAAGRLAPDAGEARWGYETHVGYFAQDHRDLIAGEGTVETWLWECRPEEGKGAIRSRLGAVLFSGDDAEKPLRSLSGGEAARLIFARLAAESPNVLLLDEPTNHLDIEAIDALTSALHAYEGTLIFVSHDRWFVSRLATRILELRPTGMLDYAGTYEDFVAHTGSDHLDGPLSVLAAQVEGEASRAVTAGTPSAAEQRLRRKEQDRERKRLEKRRDQATESLTTAETELARLQARFCESDFYSRHAPTEIAALQQTQSALEAEIAEHMRVWEETEDALSALEM